MYNNFRAEIARNRIKRALICKEINRSEDWLDNRIDGKCYMPVDMAIQIRNRFFPELQIDYLFAPSPETDLRYSGSQKSS